MLRIPVCMHNVAEEAIFRPAAWNAYGTADREGADYRACAAFGPLYSGEQRRGSYARLQRGGPLSLALKLRWLLQPEFHGKALSQTCWRSALSLTQDASQPFCRLPSRPASLQLHETVGGAFIGHRLIEFARRFHLVPRRHKGRADARIGSA